MITCVFDVTTIAITGHYLCSCEFIILNKYIKNIPLIRYVKNQLDIPTSNMNFKGLSVDLK